MITFLRKIRKKLLTENKLTQYLLYAFGEIVLVVIGILIALQINNWNEWKKERQKEQKILIQVRKNISESIFIWEGVISASEDFNKNYEVVVAAKNNSLPYHDSLKTHFHQASWLAYNWTTSHSTSSFEALKNMGLDIIQNDSLSNLIIDVFDRHILRIQNQYEIEYTTSPHKEYMETVVRNLTANFDSNNYKILLEDNNYFSALEAIKGFRDQRIWRLNEIHIPTMERAVKFIDSELAKF